MRLIEQLDFAQRLTEPHGETLSTVFRPRKCMRSSKEQRSQSTEASVLSFRPFSTSEQKERVARQIVSDTLDRCANGCMGGLAATNAEGQIPFQANASTNTSVCVPSNRNPCPSPHDILQGHHRARQVQVLFPDGDHDGRGIVGAELTGGGSKLHHRPPGYLSLRRCHTAKVLRLRIWLPWRSPSLPSSTSFFSPMCIEDPEDALHTALQTGRLDMCSWRASELSVRTTPFLPPICTSTLLRRRRRERHVSLASSSFTPAGHF